MRRKNRIPAALLAALIGFAALASPALAVRPGEGEPGAVRIGISSVWDWFLGVLTSQTDEARGDIVPGDPTGGATPPESPDPTPDPATPETPAE